MLDETTAWSAGAEPLSGLVRGVLRGARGLRRVPRTVWCGPGSPVTRRGCGLLPAEVVPAAAAEGVPWSGAGSWEDAGPKSPQLGPPGRGCHLRPGTASAAVDRRLQKINLSSFWTNL